MQDNNDNTVKSSEMISISVDEKECFQFPRKNLDKLYEFLSDPTLTPGSDRLSDFHVMTHLKVDDILFYVHKTKDALDQIGQDLIQRGRIPATDNMDELDKQVYLCQSMIGAYLERLREHSLPKWKIIWQKELDRIMQEEGHVRQIMTHIESLQTDMKEEEGTWVMLKDAIEQKRSSMGISAINQTSQTSISNTNLPTTNCEFAHELKEFVAFSKFRDTGGLWRVERDLLKRQEGWLMD